MKYTNFDNTITYKLPNLDLNKINLNHA